METLKKNIKFIDNSFVLQPQTFMYKTDIDPDNGYMPPLKDKNWLSALSIIEYAFQPIVNIHTGVCYGLEALMRKYNEAGFKTIESFFDQAYQDNVLHQVDMILREKAVKKFNHLKMKSRINLFFNIDNRVLSSEYYVSGKTKDLLNQYKIPQEAFCFEISEKHQLQSTRETLGILDTYRSQGFRIAVDDCGAGFSGFQLLYYTMPDFIKIDRFFIRDIAEDSNKKLFVSSIVNIAHTMGSIVVAEGVETKQEYYSCREVGCDLIQGYLVLPPTLQLEQLQNQYPTIRLLSHNDRRENQPHDPKLITSELEYIEPVWEQDDIFDVFEKFRLKKSQTFFPVISHNYEPCGVIKENSFKDYAYSHYGRELLQNPAYGGILRKFISKFPIADIHTPIEKILEIYSGNENIEGIIIVDSMRYIGFLAAHSLLKILNEKNLAAARDQNPLSKLPGNALIYQYVSEALHDKNTQYFLVYFDFDNFKPYNDKYGFRQGDRVILLFADLLRSYQIKSPNYFAGHIGGDDFFLGIKSDSLLCDEIYFIIRKIANQFKKNAESFYDLESIEKGYILSKNRYGEKEVFPLITVSSVILHLPEYRLRIYSTEEISSIMAKMKKKSKKSKEKICISTITNITPNDMEDNKS